MVEPPNGVPDFAPIIEAVAALDPETFAIVEQDMPGCDARPGAVPDRAAARARHIFACTHLARRPLTSKQPATGRKNGYT